MKIPLTLCLLHDKDHVLLGMKKLGFGKGRWNGFGGKLEGNETIEEAAKREMIEESGVSVSEIEKMGVLNFQFADYPENILEVHVFRAEKGKGEPKESEEMRPQWFHIHEIPIDEMWPDDKYWIPLFLKNKKFEGRFLFGPNDSVLEYHLRVVG